MTSLFYPFRTVKFKDFINPDTLDLYYRSTITKRTRGKDGIDHRKFSSNKSEELNIIQRKIDNSTYHFTPYLEVLIPKDSSNPPRRLALPTIRDKILLSALRAYIQNFFFEDAKQIHQLSVIEAVAQNIVDQSKILKLDFKGYYDHIRHDILLKILSEKIKDEYAIHLIQRAISNPTLPKNVSGSGKFFNIGIPQGVPISNVLANLYAKPVDDALSEYKYYRYMDDLIVICNNSDEVSSAFEIIQNICSTLGIKINNDKTYITDYDGSFEYLGYKYLNGRWSIRDFSINRQYEAIAALFTRLKEDLKYKRWMDGRISQQTFIVMFNEDLNKQIAGAIFKNKIFGFSFYFSRITDLSQLHQLDSFVKRQILSLPIKIQGQIMVRHHVEAYYRWKYNRYFGYVTNYDLLQTPSSKGDFLEERGLIVNKEHHTPSQIEQMYERLIRKKLKNISTFSANIS